MPGSARHSRTPDRGRSTQRWRGGRSWAEGSPTDAIASNDSFESMGSRRFLGVMGRKGFASPMPGAICSFDKELSFMQLKEKDSLLAVSLLCGGTTPDKRLATVQAIVFTGLLS